MDKMIRALKLLAIAVSVFFLGYFLEEIIDTMGVPPSVENTLEILSELFSVFVAFSIFAITWHAYDKSKDKHSLLLGSTFFTVGVLILFHLLSYPFMPEFITPNSTHKAAYFLVESRIVLAVLLLASVHVYGDTLPELINKGVMIFSAVVFSIISFVFVAFYQDYIFNNDQAFFSFNPEDSTSPGMIFSLTLITGIILYACYLYARRAKETGQKNLTYLVYGSIIIVFSNLVYFSYEFSGHFLIITGFFFIYLALYKSSVEQPYEKLAEAEEELRRAAEDKYRNLFDNANDAIITTDTEDRITSWNSSAQKLFGWGAQEVLGSKLSLLIVPPDLQIEREKIVCDTLAGRPVCGVETLRQRRDGTRINVSLTTSPLMDASQNTIGLSVIIRDITERKRAEDLNKKAEEIRLENERLTLASKAKSEFLATMSHELRTPLNSIIGFSELLKQKTYGELNEKQVRYVENVLTGGNNLLRLINDILDLSRVEAGNIDLEIEKVSVQAVMDESVNLIKERAANHNVTLKKELDPQLDFIEADKQRIKQVLFNLMSNAVKFSKPEGGTVTISAKKEEDAVRFSVSDTGVGIKEEDMGRLFREFEQLDSGSTRKYGGTGLGLVISRKLVELHGGKMWAESRYGEGSTFTFSLPVAAKK